jgi:serine/threonine-protein kinase HipA
MTSDRRTQVIVYLDSPELGPCRPVGVLRATGGARGIVAFTYARSWLESRDRFAIDPQLPLVEPDQYVDGGALPGIFADTAPDRWGRMLLDRREVELAEQAGRQPRILLDWDYLLGVSDAGRMGALRLAAEPGDETFLDDRERSVPPLTRLRDLEHAASVLEGTPAAGGAAELGAVALLLAPGSSLGGARPKATVAAQDGSLWIGKFPSRADTRDVGAWEFLLTELAARAGIAVADHRLLTLGAEGRTFAARRFDRSGPDRRLFASAMTLTGRRDGEDASYLEIAMAIADHVAPSAIDEDLEQLFRRVVFNVLVANRDDHLRNHAFLRTRAGWRLAPAFDLNPAPEKPDHAMAIDERTTEPRLDVAHATAEWYRLRPARAHEVIEEVRAAVAPWTDLARELNLPKHEVALVGSVLARVPG